MMVGLQILWFRQLAAWANFLKREDAALRFWNQNLQVHLSSGRNPGRIYGTLAHYAALKGQTAQAIALLEKSIEADPSISSSWFNLGFLLQEDNQHERALPLFTRAMELDENNDRAFYGKAISLIKLERVDEAIPLLKKNIELQPLSPFGHYQLAHVYIRKGDRSEAERMIRQVSRFEPQVAKQLEKETGIALTPLV
jgi:tetratricopeptide (TPR) repeat protein